MRSTDDAILGHLDDLIRAGRSLAEAPSTGHIGNFAACHAWGASCEDFLQRVVGAESRFMRRLENAQSKAERSIHPEALQIPIAVLEAVKEAIERGLLFDRQLLAAADVFDDFLEQAAHLLENAYKDAAAMLTGAVLEATLRKLCDKHGVAFGPRDTIEPLNQKLAKATVYNKLAQKRITTWADLRNNADHAHFDQYSADDVKEMRDGVEKFAADHLR